MPAYDNTAVAAKLDLTAALLEISGADKFRFLSYRRAASALRAWPEQVAVLAAEGRLTEIPGVGPKMAVNIDQVLERGSFDALDEVSAQVPPTLAEVMLIPGVGPKRAAILYEKLGVRTAADLEAALAEGKVAQLRGFGPKTAESIVANLEAFHRHAERAPLALALPVAERLAADIAEATGVTLIEPAGSVRRREETIGDIDIVAASDDPARVMRAVRELPAVERVLGSGETKTSIELHDGLHVDVRVVAPAEWGAALQYFTGNKDHNVELREVAKKLGMKVNEYGVFDASTGERLAGA
ncbi:MAG: hypothetical protein HY876_02015, partial [Coriobacteriales bacterium]|nr:hypothetical protein [Coriobacteriales bacterium]